MITYNQAYRDIIVRTLERLNLRGYTHWDGVRGRGTKDGEPHLGNHAWPTMNEAIMTICDESKVEPLLSALKTLDEATPKQGLRAFVWTIDECI